MFLGTGTRPLFLSVAATKFNTSIPQTTMNELTNDISLSPTYKICIVYRIVKSYLKTKIGITDFS